MIKGITHIGIIVKNLDEAVGLYCDLFGLEKSESKDWPSEGMRHVMLQVGSQSFEVMEPYSGSSLAKYLEQHGEGIHHVNLVCDNLDSLVASLKGRGATVIERGPHLCFVHPKSTKGVLFELRQLD